MAPGLETFEIIIDTGEQTFVPGETISGRVIIQLGRTKSVRGVKLRFKGQGEIKWSESRGSGRNRHTTWYTAEEEYFRMDLFLLGEAGGSENIEIVSGYHVFPFNFLLPLNIPNSFEHEHGHIRYSIKAIIDRPWKFDHEKTLSFTVAAPFDLAQDPTTNIAIDDEEHTSFCCFPCIDMGSMNVHVHIPTSGYAVGEPIQVGVSINNNSSSVDVTAIKLKLKQIITLHATSKSRNEIQTIQRAENRGRFGKKQQVTVGMQVPAVPSSNFLHTNLVDINYSLHVKICVSDCHCSTKREYPIVIGERLNLAPVVALPTIQSNFPTAPSLGTDEPTELGHRGSLQYTGYGSDGPMPYPSNNPVMPYGFAPNQPHASSSSLFVDDPASQYPHVDATAAAAIGFIHVDPARVISTPEKPPPSYDDIMGK